MKERLSVIIPAHNCAKKIRRAICSILRQDYGDIELIIVENGSTDSTYEVCRNYTEKDSRCVVIKNEEASTLLARKTGIEHSSGDYITFCDADDKYANDDSLRKMVDAIKNTGADIVQFGNLINKYGKQHWNVHVENELTINRDQLLQKYIAGAMGAWNQIITPTVWSKIYRGGY